MHFRNVRPNVNKSNSIHRLNSPRTVEVKLLETMKSEKSLISQTSLAATDLSKGLRFRTHLMRLRSLESFKYLYYKFLINFKLTLP